MKIVEKPVVPMGINEKLDFLIGQSQANHKLLLGHDERFAGIEAKAEAIEKAVSGHTADIQSLTGRISALEEKCSAGSSEEIKELKNQIAEISKIVKNSSQGQLDTNYASINQFMSSIDYKMDIQERKVRVNDIIISNMIIENLSATNFKDLAISIASKLGVTIDESHVSHCKLLNGRSTEKNNYAILVKLKEFSTKLSIWKAYKERKTFSNTDMGFSEVDQRIYINDNLTVRNAEIFKKAKNLFKLANNKAAKQISAIYINDGLVIIKKLDGSSSVMHSTNEVVEFHTKVLAENLLLQSQSQSQSGSDE